MCLDWSLERWGRTLHERPVGERRPYQLSISSALYLGASDIRKLRDMISDASEYEQTERALRVDCR